MDYRAIQGFGSIFGAIFLIAAYFCEILSAHGIWRSYEWSEMFWFYVKLMLISAVITAGLLWVFGLMAK